MAATIDFLICSERSGSNLMTRMMDGHPAVCGPMPSHLIRTFAQNLLRYGDLARDAAWQALRQDVAELLEHQLGTWRTHWTASQIGQQTLERSLAAVIRTVYEGEARAHGKRRVFIKENRAYALLAYLTSAFPEARYVLLVRDPRDVALSWKRSPNHPGRVVQAVDTWREDQAQSLQCYGYLHASGRIRLVRYEDLLADPEATLRNVCDFLELRFSADMLSFHERASTRENARRIKDWGNLGGPVLRDNVRKYRGALSELEVRYVEAVCEAEMRLLGYPLDHPPGDPAQLRPEVERLEAAMPEEVEDLSAEEQAIRARRLAVVRRILRRPFPGALR